MADTYHVPTQRDIENIDFLAESIKIAFVAAKQNAGIIARNNLAESVLEMLRGERYDDIKALCEALISEKRKDTSCSHPYGHLPGNNQESHYYECELCSTKVLRFSVMYNGKHCRLLLQEPKVGDLVRSNEGDVYRVIPDGKVAEEYQINLKWAKKHEFPVLDI